MCLKIPEVTAVRSCFLPIRIAILEEEEGRRRRREVEEEEEEKEGSKSPRVREDVETQAPSRTAGGNGNWYIPVENSPAGPTEDPAIPLVSVCPEELKTASPTDVCRSRFIAALITITKRWRQPKCSVTGQR